MPLILGRGGLWRFVPAESEKHSANEVDHEISADAGAIFFPTAPAGEALGAQRDLRRILQPDIPRHIGARQIGRWRVNPGTGRAVCARR